MQAATVFWIALTSLSLIACGESAQAPETAPAPQATPAPELPTAPAEAEDAAPVEPAAVEPAPAEPASAEPAPVEAAPTQAPAAPQPAPKAAAPVADLAHGQQIYRQACAFCHDKGVAGAPRIGDAAAWSPRLAQGMDALYAAAIGGKGAMPAKGGNPALTDADVRAAVDYIAAQSR